MRNLIICQTQLDNILNPTNLPVTPKTLDLEKVSIDISLLDKYNYAYFQMYNKKGKLTLLILIKI